MSNDTLWEALNAREREIEDLEDEVKALRAEAKALRKALTRLLASVPVAGEIVGTSTVVAYDDNEWDELCAATQQAALAAGRESK